MTSKGVRPRRTAALRRDRRDPPAAAVTSEAIAPAIVDHLHCRDDYLLLADYRSYVDYQARVAEAYTDAARWTHMSILNCARTGRFSSDRSVREYCRDICHIEP